MKKILIFLLATALFTACNDNKTNAKTGDKSTANKDDYRNRDSASNDKNNNNPVSDNGSKSDNDGKANNDSRSSDNPGGWTKSDEAAWMKACSDPLKEKMGEERTNTYCSCVMEKFKIKYPSYAELNISSTEAEGEEIGKKCLREMGLGQDKSNNGSNDDNSSGRDINSNDDDNTKIAAGWPQNEKNSFMKNCKEKAMETGSSRAVSQSYCQCMMEKMESLYPDINDADKLTQAQIERIITRYKDECLRGY